MAVAAAEINTSWHIAHEAFPYITERVEQQHAAFMGGVSLFGEVALTLDEPRPSTLMATAQLARLGDQAALRHIGRNVGTDVSERLFKVAHHSSVDFLMQQGRLTQDGIPVESVHRNTLEQTVLIPEMLRKTEQEHKNIVVLEQLHAEGILDTHDVVFFSPSSTSMTEVEKREYNFFVDTETCSIQYFSAEGDQVQLNTAFVAGKADAHAERHDLQALRTLAASYGANVTTTDATELVGYAFLLPKAATPEAGIIDIVRAYDQAAGGTFYGQRVAAPQEYETQLQISSQREARFADIVDDITNQLIAEAHSFTGPMQAILRLDELSSQYCVRYAVTERDIDVAVFGASAASYVANARLLFEAGDMHRAEKMIAQAQKLDTSGACPLFKRLAEMNDDSEAPDASNSSEGKKVMSCPFCSAKVFEDPCAKRIECWDCKACVQNGVVTSKGNGGSKVRKAKAASRIGEKYALAA